MTKKQSKYVVVNFSNVTSKEFDEFTSQLAREGTKIESVEANNRRSRKDGQQTKKIKFLFTNGQAATFFVGSQGDVYQATINGKKWPLPSTDSQITLAKSVHTALEAGQAAFDKTQQRKANKVKDTANTKPISRSAKVRAEEARNQISQLSEIQKATSAKTQEKRAELTKTETEVDRLKAQLERERKETKNLEQELNQLKDEI